MLIQPPFLANRLGLRKTFKGFLFRDLALNNCHSRWICSSWKLKRKNGLLDRLPTEWPPSRRTRLQRFALLPAALGSVDWGGRGGLLARALKPGVPNDICAGAVSMAKALDVSMPAMRDEQVLYGQGA